LGYFEIVNFFVTQGNCLNYYDISAVSKSRYAFPLSIQRQIKGETSMMWTAFVAKFKNGDYLSFGTTWNYEFFDLPDLASADDIVEIINHSYVLKTGELVEHRTNDGRMHPNEIKSFGLLYKVCP
jgi:hypothetical protein